jgi:glutamate dehydrogenase
LENAAHLLYLHRFDIDSAHLDVVSDGENGNVTLLRLLVAPIEGKVPSEETLDLLERELKRTKWMDPITMDLVFDRYPWLGVTRGELITAFCALMHPVMAKRNAMAFSKTNILQSVTRERYIPLAATIADLFLDRFSPDDPLSNEQLGKRSKELRAKIDRDVEDSTATELLNKMIDIVGYTLKTNIFLAGRYSLGLRLNPAVMEHGGDIREVPYGILFSHGRRYNGYHVRFRDIARGGLRLVTPATAEGHALESARQYDECYGLALAQQLKNKDIPEGGAKAVVLVDTNNLPPMYRNFVLRKSVKAFADTVLDMIVDTEETRANVVDLFGKKEVIYLGPDEQVRKGSIYQLSTRALRCLDTC